MYDMHQETSITSMTFSPTLIMAPPPSAADECSVPLAVVLNQRILRDFVRPCHSLRCSTVDHERNLLPLWIVHWVQPLLLDHFHEAIDAAIIRVGVVVIGPDPPKLSSAQFLVNEFDTADYEIHVRVGVVSLDAALVEIRRVFVVVFLCERLKSVLNFHHRTQVANVFVVLSQPP